jgi:stage V sporulation protein SpoVS
MSDQVAGTLTLVIDERQPSKTIHVKASTPSTGLAGAISQEYREAQAKGVAIPNVSLHAIGHGAIGQAVKAIPILNGLMSPKGYIITILPSFDDKLVADETNPDVQVKRTVLQMRLIPWQVSR